MQSQQFEKMRPGFEKFFLVTDCQTHKWLTAEVASGLCVEVVDHTIIFASFEDCLPTFNSKSIEAMLWRIPGLAEYFLYFNDDCFLVKYSSPKDFFCRVRCIAGALVF